MKKIIIIVICVLCTSVKVNSQERYLRIDFSERGATVPINNVHFVQNEKTKTFSVFAEESKKTYGFQYDENKKLIAQLDSKGLKRKFKEIIGHSLGANSVRLIQKNKKGTKFGSILYDFENQQTQEIEYDIDFSNQKYLQSYSIDDTCYIFSVLKNGNTIRKWSFFLNGELTFEDFLLDKELEINKISKNIYDLIEQKFSNKTFVNITKVENRLPNSLEVAGQKSKMFINENGFYWTLDGDNEHTILLDFKLPSLEPKISLIKKTILSEDSGTSNSYILGDFLAQVVSNNEELNVTFKELKTENIVKEFIVQKDQKIDFKNSPILQEGSVYSFGATRKLEKTSKFLRKISSHNNGVSFFETDFGYRVTIGGISPQSVGAGAALFGAVLGGVSGGNILFTTDFNPASLSYNTYDLTGSTRIESILDNNFEHLEGELNSNVLDDIRKFSKDWLKTADEIYLVNDKILFGNYNIYKRVYTFYEFENY